jgi:hypothetical protein
MKFAFLIFMLPSICLAKEYHFRFHTETGHNLQYKTDARTWEEAYERAAKFCTHFFTERASNLNEDKILEIVDVCANPREK